MPAALVVVASLVAALGLQLVHVLPASAATGPTAVTDTATIPASSSVVLRGAQNDKAGSAPIVASQTFFPTDQLASLPKGSSIDQGGQRLQVVNHGTFVVNPRDGGSITFRAWTGRTGGVWVHYGIKDANGATAIGTINVQVTAGGGLDEVDAYAANDVVGVDLLANDVPGRNANGTAGSLDKTSVRFADPQVWGGTVSDGGRTLTQPGIGVATIDDHGLLTFHAANVSGQGQNTADVYYTAQDTTTSADGTQQHHSYTCRIILQNCGTAVFGTDDTVQTPFGASITFPGILNDRDSNPTLVLEPLLSQFFTFGVGPGDYVSSDKRKIRFAGRGTFTINDDGTVLYVPPKGFAGKDGVDMFVYDNRGNEGREELIVTVQPGPKAQADTATTAAATTRTVPVLANDVPGKNANGTAGSMDRTYVRFPTDGQPANAVVSAYARTLTVPGEGVYDADRDTGAVTFTPAKGFTGTATPVTYSAQDTVVRTDGRVVHNPVAATLTVSVTETGTSSRR